MANRNSNPIPVPIPIFNGKKYENWSIKMKTFFLSQNLWKIVSEGPENPSTLSESELQQQQQNDAAALFILQQALDDSIFLRISEANTATEAWDTLKAEFQSIPETISMQEQDVENCKKYLRLYNDIVEGKLFSVKQLCDRDAHALEARITVNGDTALHVAVGTKKAKNIVEYLLAKMSMNQVSMQNKEGNTVLAVAAIVGNLPAAKMIMRKDEHQSLIEVENNSDGIPLIEAARHGQREMTKYLSQFSKSFSDKGATATRLLRAVIIAGFYDLVLNLLRERETLRLYVDESLLTEIIKKPFAFRSGRRSKIKHLKEKQEHDNVLKVVRYLCEEIEKLDYERKFYTFKKSFLSAAELGVCEVVEEILKSFPDSIWFTNEKKHNILHLAVINRQEKVFNLIYNISNQKRLLLMSRDIHGNTVLHLAGLRAPEDKLNLIAGAALQMQYELKWFKEIENIVQPAYKADKNCDGETPAMVFTKAHRELVKEGQTWMIVVASSCSVVAALIATMAFAAAITVPGDYDNHGRPNFHKHGSFIVFGFLDALALWSSIVAIIIFLSLFTARYGEDGFLHVLPRRLFWGVMTLYFSLALLMGAFCTTTSIVFFGDKTPLGGLFLSLYLLASLRTYLRRHK